MQDYIQDANGNVEKVPGTGNPVISSGTLPRSKVCIYVSLNSQLPAASASLRGPRDCRFLLTMVIAMLHVNICRYHRVFRQPHNMFDEAVPCLCSLSSAWMT